MTVLKEYLKRTKRIRSSSYLLVSYIKPFAQVSTATISRWIRMVMFAAGIDINKFKAHTVQITFIFIDFRVCDFAFKTQNAPCVSRFKCVLFSDRFQFAF